MSDSHFIIAFFVLLAAGKTVMIVQCLRHKDRSTLSPPSLSASSPYGSMADMETGPEVLVEDPMTQRLVLAGDATLEDDRPVQEMIQIPPPAYTIKDEHLEFENNPPPPSFKDVVPSSSSSLSPKPRRKPSRSSISGSYSNNSTNYHRWSRHQLFRYRPPSMENSSNNNGAAESVSNSGSGVDRPTTSIEPTILQIPNVARWVAESRRDTYMAYAGSSVSSEQYPFDFVYVHPDSDTYDYHSEPHGSSSTGAGTMRIFPSLGAPYPPVIVNM